MKITVNKKHVGAGVFFCALFNGAKGAAPDITLEEAQRLVDGTNGHFDFDMVYGKTIRVSVDLRTKTIRRHDLYDAANGKGAFARALKVALAMEAALQPETEPPPESE